MTRMRRCPRAGASRGVTTVPDGTSGRSRLTTSASVVRSSPIAAASRSWPGGACPPGLQRKHCIVYHDDGAVGEPPERKQFAAVVVDLQDLRLLVDLQGDRRDLGAVRARRPPRRATGMPA